VRVWGCGRYGTFTSTLSTTVAKPQRKAYKALCSALREEVAPLILACFLRQLERVHHGGYCTARCLHAYLFFVTEAYAQSQSPLMCSSHYVAIGRHSPHVPIPLSLWPCVWLGAILPYYVLAFTSTHILTVYMSVSMCLCLCSACLSVSISLWMLLPLCVCVPRVAYGALWKTMRPALGPLVSGVLLPLFSFSAADAARWEADPADYVRTSFGTHCFTDTHAIRAFTDRHTCIHAYVCTRTYTHSETYTRRCD
jgi:hypothetical protein